MDDDTIDRVCRGVASIQEGAQVATYIAELRAKCEALPASERRVERCECIYHGLNRAACTNDCVHRLAHQPAVVHASDCAVHNEPYMPAGPCSCGLADDAPTVEQLIAISEQQK